MTHCVLKIKILILTEIGTLLLPVCGLRSIQCSYGVSKTHDIKNWSMGTISKWNFITEQYSLLAENEIVN